jgi:hypothetical protein
MGGLRGDRFGQFERKFFQHQLGVDRGADHLGDRREQPAQAVGRLGEDGNHARRTVVLVVAAGSVLDQRLGVVIRVESFVFHNCLAIHL